MKFVMCMRDIYYPLEAAYQRTGIKSQTVCGKVQKSLHITNSYQKLENRQANNRNVCMARGIKDCECLQEEGKFSN